MSAAATPPAGRRVAVFGAGIAGLTCAHELARRGHRVAVYEALPVAGGFFRSARPGGADGLPAEYSWHGLGPWYHNAFDLLRQVPFDATGSVFDRGLSRPIDFGLFPDDAPAQFYDRGLRSIPRMFRMSPGEFARWAWLMLKTWCADERTQQAYATEHAAAAWAAVLGGTASRTWRACFGPWIGSDWTRVSLHHAGEFFRKQLLSRPRHLHPADEEGGPWSHGAGDGWLLLRGPSSEVWFDRWIRALSAAGVTLAWNQPLERLEFDGGRIVAARLASGAVVTADDYVLAVNPYAAAGILARTPALAALPELCRFQPLVQDDPHVQVSFRIGFAEPVRWPRPRTAVVVADSEFNLTLFAQEQAWRSDVPLGPGIRSLWTGTSCAGTVPGRLFGLPVTRCTKEQFIAEVKAQLLACGALDGMVRAANGGRSLADFVLVAFEVWPEWIFSPQGITGPQPKWVTSTRTQPHQPRQQTPVPNLMLAGAHTRTEADVWSIEGAVESGRRAARLIDGRVTVIGQYRPRSLRLLGALDNVLFRRGLPHLLDVLLWIAAFGAIVAVIAVMAGIARGWRD